MLLGYHTNVTFRDHKWGIQVDMTSNKRSRYSKSWGMYIKDDTKESYDISYSERPTIQTGSSFSRPLYYALLNHKAV